MEKDTINSIPFLNKDNINELFEAGFTTINSIQQSTPEEMSNRLSLIVDDGYYTLSNCSYIIELANNIDNFKKKSAWQLTEEFIQERKKESGYFEINGRDVLEDLSLHLFQNFDRGLANFDGSNVFSINVKNNIGLLTKQAVFLPSKPSITFFDEKRVLQLTHQVGIDYDTGNELEYQYYCHLPEQNIAEEWFCKVEPLLSSGIIQYIPNIVVFKETLDGEFEMVDNEYTINTNKCSISTREKYYQELNVKTLSINIPFIDDIPLSLFSEISRDETDAFNSFRSFFSDNIKKIDFAKENEIIDFEDSLKGQVTKIDQKIRLESRKLKRKCLSTAIGTTFVAGVSLLIFKDQLQLMEYLTSAGSLGVGLGTIIKDISRYYVEKVSFEDNDCWYLWLLKNDASKFSSQ